MITNDLKQLNLKSSLSDFSSSNKVGYYTYRFKLEILSEKWKPPLKFTQVPLNNGLLLASHPPTPLMNLIKRLSMLEQLNIRKYYQTLSSVRVYRDISILSVYKEKHTLVGDNRIKLPSADTVPKDWKKAKSQQVGPAAAKLVIAGMRELRRWEAVSEPIPTASGSTIRQAREGARSLTVIVLQEAARRLASPRLSAGPP